MAVPSVQAFIRRCRQVWNCTRSTLLKSSAHYKKQADRHCSPAPPYQGAHNLNPIPYNAAYMGHKIHIDQNEKLVLFEVMHILAIDGYSSKVVSHATMPVKNNIIYEDVYR
ncbi:hypothetical protein LDENG_00278490 [Lucifuga dentata]|nr:hypothetical protein LDENG_00278490 [Lucifuga dentata]